MNSSSSFIILHDTTGEEHKKKHSVRKLSVQTTVNLLQKPTETQSFESRGQTQKYTYKHKNNFSLLRLKYPFTDAKRESEK